MSPDEYKNNATAQTNRFIIPLTQLDLLQAYKHSQLIRIYNNTLIQIYMAKRWPPAGTIRHGAATVVTHAEIALARAALSP